MCSPTAHANRDVRAVIGECLWGHVGHSGGEFQVPHSPSVSESLEPRALDLSQYPAALFACLDVVKKPFDVRTSIVSELSEF